MAEAFRGYTAEANVIPVEDLGLMRKQGANLLRWMLHKTFWNTDDSNVAEYLDWLNQQMMPKLDNVMAAAKDLGMKVVIDLHDVPGGRYMDGSQRLFYNSGLNDTYVKVWETIAARYQGHPALYGYGLMNEPVTTYHAHIVHDHLATQSRAASAIRKVDNCALIFSSNVWNNPSPFFKSVMEFPNSIYEVHMYLPQLYTHQGLIDHPAGKYAYPGMVGGVLTTKTTLVKDLERVRSFQLTNRAKIFVGEFSAIRWAEGAAGWLRDCIDLFDKYNWDWTYHCWDPCREGTGIWSLECVNDADPRHAKIAVTGTDRKKAVLRGFSKND